MSIRKEKIICCILILLNLAFIWGNSLLPGEVSGQISGGLLAWLKSWMGNLPVGALLLRKLGHFTEFACLGLLSGRLFFLLGERGVHRLTSPLLLGLLAACADETIQRFVEGRGSSLVDVWIDTAGVAAGICLLYVLHTLIMNLKEKRT